MPSANGPSNQPLSAEKQAQIAGALSWLKAEQNAAETPSYTSLLLHESAVLNEASGDDADATKNYRAALALDPDHRESIERLIALAERHHQLDDLDALYEQLAAAADNTAEHARANLERAFVALGQDYGASRALALLREVVVDEPDNSVAWLLIDLAADRLDDRETREQALDAQLRLTRHSYFRGLLLIEWAKLCEQSGDTDRCFELLGEAVKEASSATYLALLERERLAQKHHRAAEYTAAIEQRIRLIKQAIIDKNSGDALGVFVQHRNSTALGCFEVLAGLACTAAGDHAEAEAHLANAAESLPGDRYLDYLSWLQAERAEDWERFVEVGERLGDNASGAAAAWIWLRLATQRWQMGEPGAAQKYVDLGLGADAKSLALRAFDIHLATSRGDGAYLGVAIESATESLDTEAEKAEWLLAAAGIWAISAHDSQGARTALASAQKHGLEPVLLHQASRLMAVWSRDINYYDLATELAQSSAATPVERLDLLLELVRIRLLHGDVGKALPAVSALGQSEDSRVVCHLVEATLGNCLRRQTGADAAPHATSDQPKDSDHRARINWQKLSEQATSTEMAQALGLGQAVDHLLSRQTEAATELLDELGEQDPRNLVVMAARCELALRAGLARKATAILRRTAESIADAELRSTIALEGAWIGIREGHLGDVPQLLDLASLTHPEATSAISRWALRRVSDREPDLTARVFEASQNLGSPMRRALEHVGLSMSRGDWSQPLEMAELASSSPSPSLVMAGELLETIRDADCPVEGEPGSALFAARAALKYLARWSSAESNADAAASERLDEARQWATSDPSLVAQLEWLLVARQRVPAVENKIDREVADEEAAARDQVAARLGPKEADALRASAHIGRFLASLPQRPLLPSTSAATRLANLEVSLPGCDPRRRATALAEVGGLLGATSTPALRASLGFNQIACGDLVSARRTFAELVEAQPRSIPGWLGLRLLGELTNDPALLAQAAAALGDLYADPKDASLEWERAAELLLERLADPVRGRLALEKAVALDITRDITFHRLFRMVRDANQPEQLLNLIHARLPHARNEDERLMLHWERARCMRNLGDREGALVAVDAVVALDPHHVGALALAGEISIGLGRFNDAARFLSQLARQQEAPAKQRLMGGLAAADLFDKKLNRPEFAQDILLELHRAGHSTTTLRERLSALAIRTESYSLAVEILEVLMNERDTPAGRVNAARLALVVVRDHMKQPALAGPAVQRLLLEEPGDPEAIDFVLTGSLDAAESSRWLEDAFALVRHALLEHPLDTASLERLANISRWFDDTGTLETCLSALICLGMGTAEIDAELAALDQRMTRVPAMAIDEPTLQALSAPLDAGPVAALFKQFAEVFAEALGPTLSVLGVGKKQRVDPRAGLPLRNEIVAWAGAFGVPDFDLYVADQVTGDAVAIPTERPSLVVAASMTAPLDARSRQAVARELFALRRGTCLLRHRSLTELSALVVACCQLGGYPLRAPAYALLDEFTRAVSSALPRRLRKALAEHAQAIRAETDSDEPVAAVLRAALQSQDRAAALAAGDISHVLSHLTGQRGRPAFNNDLSDRMARLLSFALSPTYLDLRAKLGLSVR